MGLCDQYDFKITFNLIFYTKQVMNLRQEVISGYHIFDALTLTCTYQYKALILRHGTFHNFRDTLYFSLGAFAVLVPSHASILSRKN